MQAGSGAWIGQTPGASARAEWVNNAYYDSVNTRWEYIAADEANRIVLENGELKLQSADAGSADGAITWNEKLKMTVGGDFKIGAPTGIGITISSSGNVDSIGIVTASSFVGNGANLTSLNASNIGSGTVPTARLGSGTASSSTFLRGDSTFAVVNTDLVADTSPQLGGNLASNGNEIVMADNDKIKFGTGEDLHIFHDGNSRIQNTNNSSDFRIQSDSVEIKANSVDEYMIKGTVNGAVELYHNNVKKLTTYSAGVEIHGSEGANAELYLYADEGDDDADNWKLTTLAASATFQLQNRASGSWETNIEANGNGNVELYYDNSKKLETTNNGISVGSVTIDSAFDYIGLPDNGQLRCGAGEDLRIWHTGSESIIRQMNAGTGDLYIDAQGGKSILIRSGDGSSASEAAIVCNANGSTDLYHSGTKIYETMSGGQRSNISGSNTLIIGSTNAGGAMLALDGDSNGDGSGGDYAYIQHDSAGDLNIAATNPADSSKMRFYTGDGSERMRITSSGNIKIGETNSGDVALSLIGGGGGIMISRGTTGSPTDGQSLGDLGFNSYSSSQTLSSSDALIRGQAEGNHSGSAAGSALLFFTKPSSTGPGSAPTERYRINSSGHILPGVDGSYDLGTSAKRFRNVYTTDLQLSNVGTGGNEVDGTEGKWTLQEAEDTVYMINRLNGKRYKIKMEEV